MSEMSAEEYYELVVVASEKEPTKRILYRLKDALDSDDGIAGHAYVNILLDREDG